MAFKTKILLHILAAIVCSVAASSCARIYLPSELPPVDESRWLRTVSLVMKAPGEYYIDGQYVASENLVEALNTTPGIDKQRILIVIKPAYGVSYSEATQVMAKLHDAGYINLLLRTEPAK